MDCDRPCDFIFLDAVGSWIIQLYPHSVDCAECGIERAKHLGIRGTFDVRRTSQGEVGLGVRRPAAPLTRQHCVVGADHNGWSGTLHRYRLRLHSAFESANRKFGFSEV